MNIIVAGGGKVGSEIIHQLGGEGHDLTVIDSDASVLSYSSEKYDVMTVEGNAASLDVLKEAGLMSADLLIAVTGKDEINLLSCMTAHSLNPNIHTMARISQPEYYNQAYAMRKYFGLSLSVHPEKDTATEIKRALQYPGFLRQDTFADGRVEIVELSVKPGDRLDNVALSDLSSIIKCQVLVCAVLRNNESITPNGSFVLKAGDQIFVTASTQNLRTLLNSLGIIHRPVRNVLLAGGGRISYYLARDLLESGLNVHIIDYNRSICEQLALDLPKAKITCGDISNVDVMKSIGFEKYDALVSLTGLDELNIILSIYARHVNVPAVITKLGRAENVDVLSSLPIGTIVCPKEICTTSIVRYVRAMQNQIGSAITLHKIADGKAEALEFLVDNSTLNRDIPLKDLHLKKNVLICSISRGRSVIIPNGNSSFHTGDKIVVVSNTNTIIKQLNDIFED